MNLSAVVKEMLHGPPMPEPDASVWRQARSVADLGDCCARWLEGSLACQPGYNLSQPCRPDEETWPFIKELAAVNRAGFYTVGSQAPDGGVPGLAVKTSVNGFCGDDTVYRLEDLLRGSGLSWSAWCGYTDVRWSENLPRGWWWGYKGSEIASFWSDCDPVVVDVLCHAWSVNVEDPEPGRGDRLWPLLAEFGGVR